MHTIVLTGEDEDYILLSRDQLCDLNGTSRRIGTIFASTMFGLKRPFSFSMIPTLLRNATSLLKMRSDG